MAAITILPGISYDPFLVALSILIAVVASFVALRLFFQLREGNSRVFMETQSQLTAFKRS